MKPTLTAALSLALLALPSCLSVEGPPNVSLSTSLASQYVFRGVPQVEAPVFQGNLSTYVNYANGATGSLTVWGNLELDENPGDAVFGTSDGGRFTELDVVPQYQWTVGNCTAAVGLANYSFPNGGGGTSELYLSLGWNVLGSPGITVYWDVDAVEGFYANGSLSQSWQISPELSLSAGLNLGFADDDQGLIYWGAEESGLADLSGSLTLTRPLDTASLSLSLMGSTLLTSDYEDAVDAAGIETDNLVLTAGVSWSF